MLEQSCATYLQAHPEWDGESEKPANKSDLTSDQKEISWTVLCNSFGLKTGERAGKTCNGQLRHLARKFRQFCAEKDAEFSWGHDLLQNDDNYRNHCHQAP